jgi:hypothetical protein
MMTPAAASTSRKTKNPLRGTETELVGWSDRPWSSRLFLFGPPDHQTKDYLTNSRIPFGGLKQVTGVGRHPDLGIVEKQRIPFGGLKPLALRQGRRRQDQVEKQRIPFGGLKRVANSCSCCCCRAVEKQRIPFGGLKRKWSGGLIVRWSDGRQSSALFGFSTT